MAVDEAILDSYASDPDIGAPTLRLYGWRPAALSLGKSQAARGSHAPGYLREEGIDLVRRPTGGGAVLHEHERTYAVMGHLGRGPFPRGVRETYAAIGRALLAGLRSLGVVGLESFGESGSGNPGRRPSIVCFSEPSGHEIAISGRKIVGSAQLRRRGAFLQHGSILIRSDPDRLQRAIGAAARPAGFTDLEGAVRGSVSAAQVDAAVAQGFETTFGVKLSGGTLGADEGDRATRLRSEKYLSVEWTLRGRSPEERKSR
jgi:lipoate-protein ligase A